MLWIVIELLKGEQLNFAYYYFLWTSLNIHSPTQFEAFIQMGSQLNRIMIMKSKKNMFLSESRDGIKKDQNTKSFLRARVDF